MRARFLGGVAEVGRLGMVLEHQGTSLLFDYGMKPSDPPQYPEPAPKVDALCLTHSHLDHSGMVPWAAGKYEMPVLGTPVTRSMADLLVHDSLKVCKLEGYPQPFRKEDILAMNANWDAVEYGDEREFGPFRLGFHSAGHLPGSTMYHAQTDDHSVMFTGDVNLIDTRLCAKAKPVKCDTLVIEATYSGRIHPDRKAVEDSFLAAVDGVVASGGTVIVPAFACGRMQEILMVLAKEGYEVWADGMGRTISQLMLADSRFLRSGKDLSQAVEKTNIVKSRAHRERAAQGDVIVTTSGMMDGGPVVGYLEKIYNDPASAVFITGFQVPGSGGRQLLDTGTFPFEKGPEKVACEVRSFNFSAHAGHDELLKFAQACRPSKVMLFHSDQRGPLAEAIGEFAEVILPETNQVIELA